MLNLTEEQKQKVTSISKAFADAQLPYVYGAEVKLNTPPEVILARRQAFDCSEFIEYLFYQVTGGTVKVPDGAKYQHEWAQRHKIDDDKAEIGDLVFKHKNGEINHVAVIIEVKPILQIAEFEGWHKKIIIRPLAVFRNVKSGASQPVEGIFRF